MGNAVKFTYANGDTKYEYKINEYGLTTWSKTTAGSDWAEVTVTWSK